MPTVKDDPKNLIDPHMAEQLRTQNENFSNEVESLKAKLKDSETKATTLEEQVQRFQTVMSSIKEKAKGIWDELGGDEAEKERQRAELKARLAALDK